MNSLLLTHHSKLRNVEFQDLAIFLWFLECFQSCTLELSIYSFYQQGSYISSLGKKKSVAIALPSRNWHNVSVHLGWITEWNTNCLVHMIRDCIWSQRVKQSPKDDRKYPSLGGSSRHGLQAMQRFPFCFLPGVPSTPWGPNTQSKIPT